MGRDARRTFSFRVELGADALWEHLCEHDEVRESDDPAPGPAPPTGAPFLAARIGPDHVRLRRWAGPADAASPIIVIELEEDERGCIVHGHLEAGYNRSLRETKPNIRPYVAPATILVVVLVGAGLLLGGAPGLLLLPVLLVLFAIPAAAVMLPMLALWNQQSHVIQTDALWGLVGEVFTPLALPEGDEPDPFR